MINLAVHLESNDILSFRSYFQSKGGTFFETPGRTRCYHMLPYAKESNKEIQNILEHGISAFSFPHFRVETNESAEKIEMWIWSRSVVFNYVLQRHNALPCLLTNSGLFEKNFANYQLGGR